MSNEKTDLFKLLREKNVENSRKYFPQCDDWNISDWACALAGEVGEICNEVKKIRRGDGDVKRLGKEIADAQIYLDLLAAFMNLNLWDITCEKFNEVSDKIGSNVKLPEPLNTNQELHVFNNGCDTVIAYSLDDCWKFWTEHTNITRKEFEEHYCEITFDQLPDDYKITIICEFGRPSDRGTPMTKTCSEWAKSEGRGFLCSENY